MPSSQHNHIHQVERPEQSPEAKRALELLRTLVESLEFESSVISVHVKKYETRVIEIQNRIETRVKEKLVSKKALEEQTALYLLNEARPGTFPDITMAQRTLKAQWPEAIKHAQAYLHEKNPTLLIEGLPVTYTEAEPRIRREAEEVFRAEKTAAQAEIERQRGEMVRQFNALKEELVARAADPDLLRALDAWGRSPNAAGEWGEDDKGFHAGIIHFFEYRRSKDKGGRFYGKDGTIKPKHELTLDTFIAFTQELGACIQEPRPEHNPEVQKATLIGDEEGRRRLMVFTKHNLFLNAFQNQGDHLRIITAIPQDEKSYNKAVELELNPKEAKRRLNSLGERRQKLSLEENGRG